MVERELFDLDALDDDYPFEIDDQAAHLFKHATFGIDDIQEVWESQPVFYPAKPPGRLADGGRGRRFGDGRAAGQARQRRPEKMPADRLLPGGHAAG